MTAREKPGPARGWRTRMVLDMYFRDVTGSWRMDNAVWTNYFRNIPLCDLRNFRDSGKDAGVAPFSSLSREISLTLPPD
jgi:hypothetical protein